MKKKITKRMRETKKEKQEEWKKKAPSLRIALRRIGLCALICVSVLVWKLDGIAAYSKNEHGMNVTCRRSMRHTHASYLYLYIVICVCIHALCCHIFPNRLKFTWNVHEELCIYGEREIKKKKTPVVVQCFLGFIPHNPRIYQHWKSNNKHTTRVERKKNNKKNNWICPTFLLRWIKNATKQSWPNKKLNSNGYSFFFLLLCPYCRCRCRHIFCELKRIEWPPCGLLSMNNFTFVIWSIRRKKKVIPFVEFSLTPKRTDPHK